MGEKINKNQFDQVIELGKTLVEDYIFWLKTKIEAY